MAFYAQSEEARRSHSAHMLTLVIFYLDYPSINNQFAFSNPEKVRNDERYNQHKQPRKE